LLNLKPVVMFNIAIIEDDLNLRKALSDHFARSRQFECVMAVDSIEKFVKLHRDFLDIHLVLLDVMLYRQSSIRSIPLITQRLPYAEIIMFTVMDDQETIFQALCNGATGYLLKEIDFDELENRLLAVLKGEVSLLDPVVAKKILQYFRPKNVDELLDNSAATLSDKEKVVVEMLNHGHTYNEIAQFLGISINGVRYYVRNIYTKLQIKSRGELLRKKWL